MMIWKCPSGTSLFLHCWQGSLEHGLFWSDIAPNMIWMCSFIDYLSLNIIVFSSLIHHLIIFHCLIADLNTACFSFSGSTVLPPSAQLFKKCRGLQCHFYKEFRRLNRCSSISNNLHCFGINSHISKIMSIRSLVCWNEIRDVLFWKDLLKIKLFFIKDPTHVIRNIQSFDCHVFWKQKLTSCKTKMAFFSFFSWIFVSILDSDFGYIFWGSVMRWPFLWIKKKQDVKVKTQALSRKVVSLLRTYFISMHNNQ